MGKTISRIYGDASDPEGFYQVSQEFLAWLKIQNYSSFTIALYEKMIRYFAQWCEPRGITRYNQVTKQVIQRYQKYISEYLKPNGKPLCHLSKMSRLTSLKALYHYLSKHNRVLYNPAGDVEVPRPEHRLPKRILNISEVETILSQPKLNTLDGLRDRALLETLYSTGMRRMEIVNLKLVDLDHSRGVVTIRQGKGRKDRVVPIGERAMLWLEKYLAEVRPQYCYYPTEEHIFLSDQGEPLKLSYLTGRVSQYVSRGGIKTGGACHLFRHSCATLMLENGADIRYIQQLLGHAELASTQIYTQVSIVKLKQVHSSTHPSAQLKHFQGNNSSTDSALTDTTSTDSQPNNQTK